MEFPDPRQLEAQPAPLMPEGHYRRLLANSVLSVSLVAILPLVIMTLVNYYQYREAFRAEAIRPISRLTTNAKLSLESFLSERLSALTYVSTSSPPEELQDPKELRRLLGHMRTAFGGFIDLGYIDSRGRQIAYAGPYELQGKVYDGQAWFHEVMLRGVHVSDVFMGHRHLPHFVVAVRRDEGADGGFILRTTIDTAAINRRIRSLATKPTDDVFVVNAEGTMQTPSRRYGAVLQRMDLPVPPTSSQAAVLEVKARGGEPLIIGYAYIDRSPFVVMLVRSPTQDGWLSLRTDLLLFLGISVLLILGVVFWGSTRMVNRARQADLRRAAVAHKMEYTSKMAAIGRLAAGVAHEINNPLAIINERAGLLKDLLSFSEEAPPRDKLLKQVDSVLRSVERCGAITHRLLGFAKHMDVQSEGIDLDVLLREVLSFLEKEAQYRNLEVRVEVEDDLPTIESDRGQLQQVFLNIINNAFAAVQDGGHIAIGIRRSGGENVAVTVADDGVGIPVEHLHRIFEPFFSTKKGVGGTGLGLSITYGMIEKLGGQISVESEVGKGTSFTVLLPARRAQA